MFIKRSNILAVLLIVVLSLLAIMPVAGQDDVVNLVFRQNDPPNTVGDIFEQAIDQWNTENPNIQVSFETVPWAEAQNQYVREMQAGGGPDVAQMAFVWTRDLAIAELVTNLDDFIADEEMGIDLDDFLGTNLGEFDGSIYGVPFSVDTFVFGYRPDLFEEAGVESFPDTWDEMYEAAQALTVDTDEDGRTDQFGLCFPAGSGPTSGMWFLANYYLWSNGHSFMDDPDGDGVYEVGTSPEEITDAMNYFNRFFEEGLSPQSMIAIDSWGDPEYTSSLGNGQCTMIFGPSSTIRAAEGQSEAELATAADPQGSVGRRSHLGGRTLIINPTTEHPDEAWAFLKFLISQEFYEDYYTMQFPAQISLLANIVIDDAMTGYADQLPHAVTFNDYILSPPPVSAMWESTNREFGAVYSGQKNTEEAGADLAERMQELLDENSE